MNEFEIILEETLDSFFEDASSKEDFDGIIEACKSALRTAKERRKDFVEEDDDDDDDDFDDD